MSLDIWFNDANGDEIFWGNVTHNLTYMASAVELYNPLWNPNELRIQRAGHLIPFLEFGIFMLEEFKHVLKAFNAQNGWGTWEDLHWLAKSTLSAAKLSPSAKIGISK